MINKVLRTRCDMNIEKNCICLKTFRLVLDIDECASRPCDANYGICINTLGSFECACAVGYFGNGFTCAGMCI